MHRRIGSLWARREKNLALASGGAKAAASSCLPGYPIHQITHLNDGLYGNSHSWIAAGEDHEWAQIELPTSAKVAKIVFSRDRDGQYQDRVPLGLEVRLSLDGKTWKTAAVVKSASFVRPASSGYVAPVPLPDPVTWDGLVRYAFLCEQRSWQRSARPIIFRRFAWSARRSPAARPTGATLPGLSP